MSRFLLVSSTLEYFPPIAARTADSCRLSQLLRIKTTLVVNQTLDPEFHRLAPSLAFPPYFDSTFFLLFTPLEYIKSQPLLCKPAISWNFDFNPAAASQRGGRLNDYHNLGKLIVSPEQCHENAYSAEDEQENR
ncbi:MAG: hypothetical protein V4568_16300 [Pseudomonadota bacterium]